MKANNNRIIALLASLSLGACQGTVMPMDDPDAPGTPGDGQDGGPALPPGPDSGPVSEGGIAVAATALTPRCVAPCAVFFDGTATTWDGHSDADTYLSLSYQWNFGDPDSGNWAEGAGADQETLRSRNTDSGFVAVHVYEPSEFGETCDGTPCARFTAVLAVSEGDDRAEQPITVEITDPTAQWPGTATVCVGQSVEPTAGEGGCPAGAATASTDNFQTALSEICDVNQGAKRCLFRGGDTFSASSYTTIDNGEPVLVGSFGEGRAIINAGINSLVRLGDGSDGLRVVDLDVRGPLADNGGSGAFASAGGGAINRRFLALRVSVRDFNQGFHFRGNNYPEYDPANHMHSELAIVDSSVTEGASFGGNDIFMMGDPYAIVGSRVADKRIGDGEHVIRAKFSRRSIIAHNSLGLFSEDPNIVGCDGPDQGPQGRLILKMVSGFAVTLPEDRYEEGFSREFIVADNLISACRDNAYQLSIGATDQSAQKGREHLRYFIVEDNLFRAPEHERESGTFQFARTASSSHFVVRNNTFHMGAPATTVLGVVLDDNEEQYDVPGHIVPQDGRVFGNTFYNSAEAGTENRAAVAILDDNIVGTQIADNVVYDETGSFDFMRGAGSETVCCDGDCSTCNVIHTEAP